MRPTRMVANALASIYRSGQTFVAVRQLRRAVDRGVAPEHHPALQRLAGAMQVDVGLAKDTFLSSLSPNHRAHDHRAVARALQRAAIFAPLSPATGRALGQMRQHAQAARGSQLRSLTQARKRLRLEDHNTQAELTFHLSRREGGAAAALAGRQARIGEELRRIRQDIRILARDLEE